MITESGRLVDLGLLNDNVETWGDVQAHCCRGAHQPPPIPRRFAEDLKLKHFTNGSDRAMVAAMYTQTFEEVVASVKGFNFENLGWGPEDMVVIVQMLKRCEDRHFEYLNLAGNCFGDEGVMMLIPSLQRLTGLQRLSLARNGIGHAGAKALEGVILKHLPMLAHIDVSDNLEECKREEAAVQQALRSRRRGLRNSWKYGRDGRKLLHKLGDTWLHPHEL